MDIQSGQVIFILFDRYTFKKKGKFGAKLILRVHLSKDLIKMSSNFFWQKKPSTFAVKYQWNCKYFAEFHLKNAICEEFAWPANGIRLWLSNQRHKANTGKQLHEWVDENENGQREWKWAESTVKFIFTPSKASPSRGVHQLGKLW